MNKNTLVKNLFESNFDFDSIEHNMDENMSNDELHNYMYTRFSNKMAKYEIDITMYVLLNKIGNTKVDKDTYRDLYGYIKLSLVELLKSIDNINIVMNNIVFVNEHYVKINKCLDYDTILNCIESIIELRKYLPLHSVLYFSFITNENKIVLFDQGQLNLDYYGYDYESERYWHNRHYIMSESEFDILKNGYGYTFQREEDIK